MSIMRKSFIMFCILLLSSTIFVGCKQRNSMNYVNTMDNEKVEDSLEDLVVEDTGGGDFSEDFTTLASTNLIEEQNDLAPIPTYEEDTVDFKNMFGGIETYSRYSSADILNDIENSRGPLSDRTIGMWKQVFYMLGYDNYSFPVQVDCYKNPYGRIAFILPNGNIYMDDYCYAILVAYKFLDEDAKESFFNEIVNLNQLAAYVATYGPKEVGDFIKRWFEAEGKKQKAIQEWLDSWKIGSSY